ncbi:YcaO-like family protein [Rhizohabitans arisaemae]|uniref:YcaO-like family protein n=1 Tax=Rhizohabitans arisaemae TaxID=2720610 RepID=UPI0024B25B4E|nr:YcaO-like family protein [Rhizohabitans arisaemae]
MSREDTAERVYRLALAEARSFGVTRVARLTALDTIGIPVYQAIRPRGLSLAVSQGKGRSDHAAIMSALMECLEMSYAETIAPDLTGVSAAELSSELPYRLEALRHYGDDRLAESTPTSWVRGRTLSDGRATWLPWDGISLDSTIRPLFRPVFAPSSAGQAAGVCRTRAISHALLELLERHSVHLLGQSSRMPRRLSAEELIDNELGGRLAGSDVEIRLYDATQISRFPCVMAFLRSPELASVVAGSACRPTYAEAATDALMEAIQCRATVVAGSRDDLHLRNPPGPPPEMWDAPPLSRAEPPSAVQVLSDLVRTLEELAAGPVVAVDLRRQDEELYVVKCVVPGLEH